MPIKKVAQDPIVESEPVPAPEPLISVTKKDSVSLHTESKDGKVIDNNYQVPNQPGYERFVSESNPTGKH